MSHHAYDPYYHHAQGTGRGSTHCSSPAFPTTSSPVRFTISSAAVQASTLASSSTLAVAISGSCVFLKRESVCIWLPSKWRKGEGRCDRLLHLLPFFNHQTAVAALHALNGVKFDPQTGSILHIELARSNSRRKRVPGSGAYVVIDKRSKTSTNAHETSSDDGDSESDEPAKTSNPDSGNNDDLVTAKSGEMAVDPDSTLTAVNEQPEKTTDAGLPPCSTLFIANLGPTCTEDELKQVLSQYPGFNVLKMRAKGGMPVALLILRQFVVINVFHSWQEIEQANKAMDALQGSMLASSDRGGMHLEYARSKMRKP
ncbi:hypothetical protein CK203_068041 [Vitis vinifera]|uniref:RRM domain-containing protein n=1 Tax=Vitis vinifera TaxID=29760 RepID=A0A438EVZ4_VITVI|nr:hypothetical protein CK203_068041 [Vitis vinifera]